MATTLADLVVKVGADIGDLQRKMSAAQKSVNTLGDTVKDVGRTLTVGLSLPLVGIAGSAVSAAAEMDSLTRGLTAVTGSATATQTELARLQEVAKLPGLGFREAIRGATALQAAGLSAGLAERSLRAFGNALATVGRGKADLDGVINSLSQIASGSKVTGDNIREIAQRLPQFRQAMQAAFGTADPEQLQKMGIAPTEFIERVVQQLAKLQSVSGGVGNSFENLSDAWFKARVAIGNQLLPAVIPLVEGLGNMLTKVNSLDPAVVRTGLAVGAAAAAMGPLLVVVSSLIPAITALSVAGTGLAVVFGAGGALVLGLGVVIALLAQTGLNALAAAGQAEQAAARFRVALSGMDDATLAARATSANRVFAATGGLVQDAERRLAEARAAERRRERAIPFAGGSAGLAALQGGVVSSSHAASAAAARQLRDLRAIHAQQLANVQSVSEEISARKRIADATRQTRIPLADTSKGVNDLRNDFSKLEEAVKAAAAAFEALQRVNLTTPALRPNLGITQGWAKDAIARANLDQFKVEGKDSGAKKNADDFSTAVRAAQIGLDDLSEALGDLGQPLRGALQGLAALSQGLSQLKSGKGLTGIASIANTIGGIGAIVGGAITIGKAIGGLLHPPPNPVIVANTRALEKLANSLRGGVTFGEQSAALAQLRGLHTSAGLGRFGTGVSAGNLGELKRVAESLGIQLVNEKGKLVAGALKQLEEALRLSAASIGNFAASIEGQWKLLDAQAQIHDVTSPVQLAQVELQKLLAGLSEQAEVQFGLVGLNLNTGAGQNALNEALNKLIDAFAAGALTPAMLSGFESVDQFLSALLGADSALDKLSDTANRLNASMINVSPGFKIALRAWQAQDAVPWSPPTPPTGPTTDPTPTGGVTIPMTFDFSGVRSQWTASDQDAAYAAAYELVRQGSVQEGGAGPVTNILTRLRRPGARR